MKKPGGLGKSGQRRQKQENRDDYKYVKPADEESVTAYEEGEDEKRTGTFCGGRKKDVPGSSESVVKTGLCLRELCAGE